MDTELCTGCGICQEKCPKKVVDDVFEAGLGYRKAVYTPFPQAVPKYPVIDGDELHLLPEGHLQGAARSSARPAPSISTSKMRS